MRGTVGQEPVAGSEFPRRREIALATVAAAGPPRVAELLIAAMRGDPLASRLGVGSVLRALPEVGWLGAHDLLLRAGIPDEATPLGELTREQRIAVAAELTMMRAHPAP